MYIKIYPTEEETMFDLCLMYPRGIICIDENDKMYMRVKKHDY